VNPDRRERGHERKGMAGRVPEPLPDCVQAIGESASGRAWVASLPDLLDEVAERWQLQVGDPYPDASASLILRANRMDGTQVVLKLQYPHREAEHEAAALALWAGGGAVRLFAHDPDRHALLLEPCEPGTPLLELEQDAALDVLIELLPRLWRPAGSQFISLATEAEHWASTLPHAWERAAHPFEPVLLDAALDAIARLASTQGEQVLLHQDLHTGNVLRAAPEPWLVIDPKPLRGEREFGLAPIVRGAELGHSRDHVLHRLDRLTGELRLDRRRACGWAFVQTLAWSIDQTEVWPEMIEIARWLRDEWAGE
jgi:streptomycin 6-kinase